MKVKTRDSTEIATVIHKMLFIVADLQRDLEVYRGLFDSKEDTQIFRNNFGEIEATLRVSISTKLILGVTALLVDPWKSSLKKPDENFSIKTLKERIQSQWTPETEKIWICIEEIVSVMNINQFRAKRLAHFDYDVLTGNRKIEATIPTEKLDEVLRLAQDLLHQISMDIGYSDGARSYFYTPIPKERSPKEFLDRISKKN